MKILYITGNYEVFTGIGRHTKSVCDGLTSLGHEVKVFRVNNGKYQTTRLILVKFFLLFFFLLKNTLKAIKESKGFDIIYAHDFFPYAIIANWSRRGKQKLFINGIGTELFARLDKPIIGWLLRRSLKNANQVFCISHYTRDKIKEEFPDADNLAVVYLGVDFQKFYQDLKIKTYFDSQRNNPTIVSVGMVKRRKGFDVVIKSLVEIKKVYPKVKYYIIGAIIETNYITLLKDLIRDLNLESNVIFTNKISDEKLIEIYKEADVFVLTPINIGNHFEGFGLVYLEANAAGLPVIGTYDCGAKDAIKIGENGYLVDQEDVSATAQKIIELLSDTDKLKSMSISAQVWAKKFTWEKTVTQYEKFFNS